MRVAKISLVVLAAALMAVGVGTTAYAFHSGGVAECEGCHSMHSPAPGGVFLLVGTDPSSACLTCHEHAGDTGPTSYHISTADADMVTGPPIQRSPGGDFGWVKKTFSWVYNGVPDEEPGYTHGHNIIAADFGYEADGHNALAPGGSFPATDFSCVSCHDPHGKYRRQSTNPLAVVTSGEAIMASGSYPGANNEPSGGNAVGVFRILAGAGYSLQSGTAPTFPGVPPAKVPNSYNRSEATSSTRVAYGTGAVATASGAATWGNWCGACHGEMHSFGNYVHPVDHGLGSAIKINYDKYVKSGDMTGTNATAFTSLVPFATAAADYATLAAAVGTTTGPATSDQVNCMSCHRAHASGWEYALRWYYQYEFITKDGKYVSRDSLGDGGRAPLQHRGRSDADAVAAYYDRPASVFASYQRSLCNKCHAKD
jgi:hypothetical protein